MGRVIEVTSTCGRCGAKSVSNADSERDIYSDGYSWESLPDRGRGEKREDIFLCPGCKEKREKPLRDLKTEANKKERAFFENKEG